MNKPFFRFLAIFFIICGVTGICTAPVFALETCENATTTIHSDTNDQIGGESTAVPTLMSPIWATIPGATWIWSTPTVTNPNAQETVTFTKNFTVTGTIQSALLKVLADDYMKVFINNTEVISDFGEGNFLTPHEYTATTTLHSGLNTLRLEITNAAYYYAGQGTPSNNPAGLAYSYTIMSSTCTTTPDQTETTTGGSGTGGGSGSGGGVGANGPIVGSNTVVTHQSQTNSGGNTGSSESGASQGVFETFTLPTIAQASGIAPTINRIIENTTGTSSAEEPVAPSQLANALSAGTSLITDKATCILIGFIIALIIYMTWVFINRKRDTSLSGEKKLSFSDISFFIGTSILTSAVLFYFGVVCPIIPLLICVAIIMGGIFLQIL